MDEPVMRNELYGQAQHLYRRREELEARVDELCPAHMAQVIVTLEYWGKLDAPIVELIFSLIELRMDEEKLVEDLGPGWRVTDSGIAFSPLWGSDA